MAVVRGGTYVLQEYDFDLQNNPPKANMGFAEASLMYSAAKKKALELLNKGLKKMMGVAPTYQDIFTENDFTPSQFGRDKQTTKTVAVEWKAEKKIGNGQQEKKLCAIIDVDDIPPNAVVNGPDRPHVGMSFWIQGTNNPGLNTSRVNGHIFVDYVFASRNT